MSSKTSVQRDDFSYGTPVEEVQPSRDSKIVVALLAMQSVVLIALLAGGLYAYRELEDKTNRIDAVVTIVEDPSKLLNQPQLVQSLVGLMQNTTSAFFFGDADGAIPSFINNLMLFDFGPWGASISDFASDVTNTFQVNSNSSLCSQWITCTPNTQVQCGDNSVQWCYDGQVNCAPVSTCVAPSIVTGASLVGSVAERFALWTAVNGTTDGTPAFSNGLFRLDLLLEWVRSQMSSPKWQNAGMTCESFVRQVRSINWNGTYFDTNNQAQSWDANSQVSQVANYVEQVCNGLKDLAQQKEQQPKAKAQAGAAKHGVGKVSGVKAHKPQQQKHSHKGKH